MDLKYCTYLTNQLIVFVYIYFTIIFYPSISRFLSIEGLGRMVEAAREVASCRASFTLCPLFTTLTIQTEHTIKHKTKKKYIHFKLLKKIQEQYCNK